MLTEDLEALRTALVATDLPAAQAAAHEAHETNHDLSAAAYEWLGEQDGATLMSSLISSRTLGTVRNVNTAISAVPWEGELHELAETAEADLSALAAALAANDAVASAEATEYVHHAQHDFSRRHLRVGRHSGH